MDIRSLDFLRDSEWERFFIKTCGLNYDKDYKWNRKILTREMLETHLDDIVDKIISFRDYIDHPALRPNSAEYGDGYGVLCEDDIHIGYQILGILILQTGSYLPKIVEDSIIFSTRWEYDKQRMWTRSIERVRKENLEKFRKAIQMHQVGKAIYIDF